MCRGLNQALTPSSKRALDLNVIKREEPHVFEFPTLLIRNWKTSLLGDPNHSLSQRRNCEGLNNSSADQGCVCEQMEP
ncbi:hypothetical protein K1719_047156 [Acacia pycnantha]|nr:hypothetical protein K1719_047156 [Acacia pycnantha]